MARIRMIASKKDWRTTGCGLAASGVLVFFTLPCVSFHLCAIDAAAQALVCPEVASDMVVVHDSSPDSMGRIAGQVKSAYGGQMVFHCLYTNQNRAARNRIGHGDVTVTWVPPDAAGPGRASWRACGRPPSHSTSASSGYNGSLSSASRMVTVGYSAFSGVGYDPSATPLQDVAARLLPLAEAPAAPCSGSGSLGPGPSRPSFVPPPGNTGPIGGAPPFPSTGPITPSNSTSAPMTVPGSSLPPFPEGSPQPIMLGPSSPSAPGPGIDVTRRDIRSGPLVKGGSTRMDGDIFHVESAPEWTTYTVITARPVGNFRAEAGVRFGTATSATGGAGLYISSTPTADYRAGDIFFGVNPVGIALQEHDGMGWRNIPQQTPPPAFPARLGISRTGNQYQFYYNGVWIAELNASGRGDTHVLLFAAAAVIADFSAFSVSAMGATPVPALPAGRPQ